MALEAVSERDVRGGAGKNVLVIDRIRPNINVEVYHARHVPCDLHFDICASRSTDTDRKHEKKATDLVTDSF